MTEKRTVVLLGVLALLLATPPVFFETYRAAAFNTIPRDDYGPYLLALVGEGGEIPPAPFAYRIGSVAAAIPFYHALPTYAFTNLPDVRGASLRATQALSFSSYLSVVLTSVLVYAIARRRCRAARASSMIGALASVLLSSFVSRTGIDPFAILTIGVLVLWLESPVVFVPVVLASVGINEKIPIALAALLMGRLLGCLVQRRRFELRPQLLSSCLAVAGYFAMIHVLKVPGSEAQTDPTHLVTGLRASLGHALSLRGFFLNGLPVVLVSLVAVLAIRSRRRSAFHVSDVSCLVVLLVLALFADVAYNVGRIVMHCYPVYLPAACSLVDDLS